MIWYMWGGEPYVHVEGTIWYLFHIRYVDHKSHWELQGSRSGLYNHIIHVGGWRVLFPEDWGLYLAQVELMKKNLRWIWENTINNLEDNFIIYLLRLFISDGEEKQTAIQSATQGCLIWSMYIFILLCFSVRKHMSWLTRSPTFWVKGNTISVKDT